MAKNRVLSAVEGYIERVAGGDAKPEEIATFPAVVQVYFVHCGTTKHTGPPELYEPLASAPPLAAATSFPTEGRVTVKQVAAFLGIAENTIWQRLNPDSANYDPEFPQPVIRERRNTRWDAAELWEHRRQKEAAA